MQALHQHEIWTKAKAFKGRGPTVAAIAYVNADLLGFRAGDTLVCDASDGRIATAATSAAVLARMHKKGVVLFHLPNLHAKTVRMPRGVLIGSANMTENSRNLQEVSLLSDEPDLVSQVDDYFRGLFALRSLQKIDRRFLARILAIEVTANGGGGGKAAQRKRLEAEEARPRMWVTGAEPISERGLKRTLKAMSAVTDEDLSEAELMQWGSKEQRAPLVRLGDFMVRVDCTTRRADRPARVVGVFESAQARLLVHKFADTPAGSISWERLRKVLRETGAFSHPTGIPTLLRLDSEAEARVRALYRPVR